MRHTWVQSFPILLLLSVHAPAAVTTLHEMSDTPQPNTPLYGSLVLGSDGDFYGMTARGGANDVGAVFRMTPFGTLRKR